MKETQTQSRSRLALVASLVTLMIGGAALTVPVVVHIVAPGAPYAEVVLLWALPDPQSSRDPQLGFTQFTAAELTAMHQGAQWGTITYVPADVPSTRPDMVSVNPIDTHKWGAAAYSSRAGACYMVLSVLDSLNPAKGHDYYGRLARGMPCVGSAATSETVAVQRPLPE